MKPKSLHKPESPPRSCEAPQEPAESTSVVRSTLTLKQLLVPIDFSACSVKALEYALGLAQKFAARLILLHVVEPAVYPENYLVTPATLDEANQNLMTAGRERLAVLSQRASSEGLSTESLVRMGRAHSEIPDTAKATATDLIVMGTHGHAGLKHVLLGSTAERVMRHSPCPVLMVRQQ